MTVIRIQVLPNQLFTSWPTVKTRRGEGEGPMQIQCVVRVIEGEGKKRKEERKKGGVKYAERERERERGRERERERETRVALTNVPHTTERDREEWPKLQRDDDEEKRTTELKEGDGRRRGRDAKMTGRGHVDKVLETREAEGS